MPNQADTRGDTEEAPEYLITIEYEEFLTRLDLDEIIKSIDRIIEDEVLGFNDTPWRYLVRERFGPIIIEGEHPKFSYVGIRSIDSGSITLTVIVGGAILAYAAKRFRRGVAESLLADELQRSGRLTGDVLGTVLGRINNWAERYVPVQREMGGNVKKISVRRKDKGDDHKRVKK